VEDDYTFVLGAFEFLDESAEIVRVASEQDDRTRCLQRGHGHHRVYGAPVA
jgi:hypothetical protein